MGQKYFIASYSLCVIKKDSFFINDMGRIYFKSLNQPSLRDCEESIKRVVKTESRVIVLSINEITHDDYEYCESTK